jgi:TolA-binding protein
MRASLHVLFRLFLILISLSYQTAFGQLGFDLKIDKPKPYEERVLRSEKTGEKPLNAPRKFFQNLTTHYNYFFNASNRLNEVIFSAKSDFKEDYTTILPFYNYTLDATAQNQPLLDSVIYKSRTGIVMHDLRNDWIDNLYLLWGAAWYFEKKFDSAALMFQFINYSFAEKEKDGYYKYIGSRMDGNNALTISTPEKDKFPKSLVTPPSRNNAFIWQIRTLIELGNFPEAGSLIATLKNDPLFPKRLNDDLEEVQAYWFYKQNIWDSSAAHLVKALGLAATKHEKARWEYLAAQMQERAGNLAEAEKLYTRSIAHTTDPVMDVYGRLNLVRINKSGGEHYIDENIAMLLKMAKRDKYSEYRDVIYFMAAQMEMERNNFPAAQELLLKGAKYNNSNLASRSKSYLLIADLSFDQKKYIQAASFYDSIQSKDIDEAARTRVGERKALLFRINGYSRAVSREDSLQRIAAMPDAERTVLITRMVKQLRKQQGLEDVTPTSGNFSPAAGTDLFATQQPKGEWYFYNNTLKTQGLVQFKQNWGSRPNVDNWRRFADVNQQLLTKVPTNVREANRAVETNLTPDNTPTFTSLMNNLPLTPAQLQVSNDSLRNALFGLGTTLLNEAEDYTSAIEAFERIRKDFPGAPNTNEVLFNLYYAYKKTGNDARAEEIRKLLLTQYPASRFAAIVATGKDPAATDRKNGESTKAYEAVYDLFISGQFEEAEVAKKNADSVYHTNFWQPQLLYIEAVYHIRQRNDSVARNILQTLISQGPNTPLAVKAQNLVSVLSRRRQIEEELTRLQIEHPREDSSQKQATVQPPLALRRDSLVAKPKTEVPRPLPAQPLDTAAKKPIVKPLPVSVYKFDPGMKHYVMIILDKVDPMFVNEVKNAFDRYHKEVYYNQTFSISIRDFDADRKLVLVGEFGNAQEALDYVQKTRRRAPNEIIPWLKADKYEFSITTDPNLDLLLQKKDLTQYKQFLDQNLPGKF